MTKELKTDVNPTLPYALYSVNNDFTVDLEYYCNDAIVHELDDVEHWHHTNKEIYGFNEHKELIYVLGRVPLGFDLELYQEFAYDGSLF